MASSSGTSRSGTPVAGSDASVQPNRGTSLICKVLHIGRHSSSRYDGGNPRGGDVYAKSCIFARRPRGCPVNGFADAALQAARLVAEGNPKLVEIVALSLEVSLAAVAVASLVALPAGAFVAVARFPGRKTLIVVLNALMGLPSVVVGLAVYLLLSRAGPLGGAGILFTPTAMVIAQ